MQPAPLLSLLSSSTFLLYSSALLLPLRPPLLPLLCIQPLEPSARLVLVSYTERSSHPLILRLLGHRSTLLTTCFTHLHTCLQLCKQLLSPLTDDLVELLWSEMRLLASESEVELSELYFDLTLSFAS